MRRNAKVVVAGALTTSIVAASVAIAAQPKPGILLSGNPDEGALIGRTKATAQPPGRGRIVSRELGEQVLQLAWQPPRLG